MYKYTMTAKEYIKIHLFIKMPTYMHKYTLKSNKFA